jgi:23S rRNA pseudouridine1911/1915/1917 synthase
MHVTETPYILDETDDFAVVYKPPCMHCAPSKKQDNETLTDWYGKIHPAVFSVNGKRAGEGGLLHRLDFHTRGLVLFAKNQKSFDFLQREQDEGRFIKEYRALCRRDTVSLPGFPPRQEVDSIPPVIESYFRAFGPGRKEVRPVCETNRASRAIASDRGAYYRTEVCRMEKNTPPAAGDQHGAVYSFDLKIRRGFRHQIRCHLAWIGYPIINDPLYGQWEDTAGQGCLALCSYGLSFTCPDSVYKEYRIA